MEKRYQIDFKYADEMSNFQWRTQSCMLYAKFSGEAVQKCKELYGLGVDCEYEITNVKEVN